MKHLYLLLFLSVSTRHYSQTELHKIPFDENKGVHSYSSTVGVEYFNLPKTESSQFKFHIRRQTIGQIIDLYSNDGQNFKGLMINFIIEEHNSKKTTNKKKDYIYEKIAINDSLASKSGYLLLSQKFYTIPTDKKIPAWSHNGLDCEGINYEFKIDDYSAKNHYSCYKSQNEKDSMIFTIQTTTKEIDSILKVNESRKKFMGRLDKGKWYYTGFSGMYKMTEKEIASWNKSEPIREYQKSVKDSIDDYLNSNLNVRDSIECFESYELYFSKEGRLKKIYTNERFFERLFNREHHQCRKKIKNLFKKLNLNHLNLKYGFYRDISFNSDGTFDIGDRTVY